MARKRKSGLKCKVVRGRKICRNAKGHIKTNTKATLSGTRRKARKSRRRARR